MFQESLPAFWSLVAFRGKLSWFYFFIFYFFKRPHLVGTEPNLMTSNSKGSLSHTVKNVNMYRAEVVIEKQTHSRHTHLDTFAGPEF